MCARPDFAIYLISITESPELAFEQRRMAAVLLKSLLERRRDIAKDPYFQYTKSRLAALLQNAAPELASIISNSIVTILRLNDFSVWPDILKLLNALIRTGKAESVENAVQCLEKLCEDVKVMYQVRQEDFLSIVPSLVEVAKNKALNDKIRGAAVNSLSLTYSAMGSSEFGRYLLTVVPMMLECMRDPAVGQKSNRCLDKSMCGLSVMLHSNTKEEIAAIASPLFDYHTKLLGSADYEVAYAACDFWKSYLHITWSPDYEEQKWELLESSLPRLLPQLLCAMKYTANDLAGMIRDTELDVKYSESEDLNSMEEGKEGLVLAMCRGV